MKHLAKVSILIKSFFKKIISLRATPNAIALGFAVGVFIGILPTFGLGGIVIAFFATFIRFNVPAAIAGTLIGNPLFAPLWIFLSCFVSGIHFGWIKDGSLLIHMYDKIIVRYLFGNAFISLIVALISFLVIRQVLKRHAKNREKTLVEHAIEPAIFKSCVCELQKETVSK